MEHSTYKQRKYRGQCHSFRGPAEAFDSTVNSSPVFDAEKQTYEPTEEEHITLRKGAGNLPLISFFAMSKGNGAGVPPCGTQETAGGLGMGFQASFGLVLLFSFLTYVLPILVGGADIYEGRYKAICGEVLICGVAHVIHIISAIPSVLQKGTARSAPPFIISLLVLALGTIVDPELTFSGVVNIGSLYILPTTYAGKYVGCWLSFLLAGTIHFLLPIVLALVYKKTYKKPPSGTSDLNKASKIRSTVLRCNKFQVWRKNFFDATRPSVLASEGIHVDWTDKLVDDFQLATETLLYFAIYNINDGSISSVESNQIASMTINGAPNDVLNDVNTLALIIATPIASHIVCLTLQRYNIKLGCISRMTFGFILAIVSGDIGAIVQWRMYKASPCRYHASSCDAGVSLLLIWWQLPNVILGALSELFYNMTVYELAHAHAPPSMRGLVRVISLFTTAFSSALGEVLISVT
ncbi:uncharacterized protein BDW43DRAFT_298495 [Aspergillus alliaceus]|uniref:uncharacterized protein n=1 Tax=Petromyces alliaceus TaxID=209559 RepID=UPI0012A45C22|nr:uncharacterized protein BDW43DRAFT_298495 [Aspergillus alliaceus]KAB8235893.1 hypothetical protein BDW43DRAFT_298495 [Aspergillus alliaceus]